MAAQGKKKPKMKGTKMNLTEFLSDEKGGGGGPVMAGKIDWAAEMETSNDVEDFDDIQYGRPSIDRSKLPTAPKASRGPDVDPSRIPNNPPFTAFIGNLPYDTTADKIEQFFQKLNVLNVRLPSDQGRMKGFGYVEFGDKQSLIDALLLNDEVLSGRKVRVDLAGQNQQNDQRSGGGFGRERQNDGPDRTEGDWRRGPPPESEFDRGGDRYGDRGGDRYGDRGGDRYGDRGGDRYGDRGGDRYGNRDGDRYGDRGGDRYGDRGGDRYGDRRGSDRWGSRDEGRGFDRDDRDGGSRGFDRGSSYRDRNRDYDDRRPSRGYDDRGQRDRYDDDRGPQRDRYDDRGPPRDRYDDRGPQRDRYDDRGPPRDRYDNRRGYDRRDGGGYGRDRYDDRERRGGFGAGYRRDDRQRSPETPAERPRLNLQPRTKPIEEPAPEGKPSEGKPSEDKPSEGNAPKVTPPKPSSASIFGGAKPVDTAAREREIEERLQKQRLEEAKKLEEEKENRYVNNPSADRGYRKRRDSENSQEDGYSGSRRERRLSSGSSSKGRSGPPPVTSSRSRKDSNTSNHSQEVFSGGEGDKDEPKSPVSPSSSNDQPRSPPVKEDVKLVPAPPPAVNPWQKRRVETKSATVSVISGAVETTTSSQRQESRSQPESPPHQDGHSPKGQGRTPDSDKSKGQGHHTETRPSDPPKSNPWFRNKDGQDGKGDSPEVNRGDFPGQGRGDFPGQGRSGDFPGRGRRGGSSDRGRGRGGKPSSRGRDKHVPRSVDEMPKVEDKSSKDWSDRNKFAGLIDDDDEEDNNQDNEVES